MDPERSSERSRGLGNSIRFTLKCVRLTLLAAGAGQERVGEGAQEDGGVEALPDGGHLVVRLVPGVEQAGVALLTRLHLQHTQTIHQAPSPASGW